MTQQEKYLERALAGATLAEPTIEETVVAFQEHFYPRPQLYRIVDAYDAYLWRALADSERQTIALIEACRPRTEGSA